MTHSSFQNWLARVLLVPLILFGGTSLAQGATGPQTFDDLTLEDFIAKVSEIRTGDRNASVGVSFVATPIVGGEANNNEMTNQQLLPLHQRCDNDHGEPWRARSGTCSRNGLVRQIRCGRPDQPGQEEASNLDCPDGRQCELVQARNYINRLVNFPICGLRVEVKERHDAGTSTQYEGHYVDFPLSPGTIDYFIQAAPNQHLFVQLNAGSSTYKSSGFVHSWTCLRCPNGNIDIIHPNSPSYALVYSHDEL